jgi:hypothetical protein
MKKPAPFQARPDRLTDAAPIRRADPAAPRPKPLNTALPGARLRDLPADGPGHVRVIVTGPAVRLVPLDAGAEAALLAARAQLGWTYDAKAGRRIDHMGVLIRNGAANFASIRLLAEVTGLVLEIDDAARRAVDRRATQLARDLAPIPRVVWVDDETHDQSIMSDRSLGR